MKRKFWLVIAVVMLAFFAVGTVYANFTWGAVTRTWLNPGYQVALPVTALTANDKTVCMTYSWTGATSGGPITVECSCQGGGSCPNATWTCNTNPLVNIPNVNISWQINAQKNGCSGVTTTGPTGNFNTGATAVTLATLDAQPQPVSWLLPVGLALLAATMTVFVIRRRRAQ
jgi:hypothetical protein